VVGYRSAVTLSGRELEVLAFIAADLPISTGTVKTYANSLHRKLDPRGRAQALVRAGQTDPDQGRVTRTRRR